MLRSLIHFRRKGTSMNRFSSDASVEETGLHEGAGTGMPCVAKCSETKFTAGETAPV